MLTLIFLAVLVSVQAYFDCPTSYTSNSINRNGVLTHYCYKVYTNQYTRQQARVQCLQDGATLAAISSSEENQMYRSANSLKSMMYIGLSCLDNNNCAFDDGTPYNSSKFSGFASGMPKTEDGYCVYMATQGADAGKWSSVDCEVLVGAYVCHYNPNSAISQKSGCNAFYILDETPVVITSPNYPNKYDALQTCSYFIQGSVSASYGVNITFTDFHTDEDLDPVRINNGGYKHKASLIGAYSGKKQPFTVLTDDYESLITFIADGLAGYNGFSAIVSSYKK